MRFDISMKFFKKIREIGLKIFEPILIGLVVTHRTRSTRVQPTLVASQRIISTYGKPVKA